MRLEIFVKPGSKRPAVERDGNAIVVRVRERAIGGAANAACIAALATYLGVPPSAVRLVRGARSRHKLVDIAGITPAQVLERIGPRND